MVEIKAAPVKEKTQGSSTRSRQQAKGGNTPCFMCCMHYRTAAQPRSPPPSLPGCIMRRALADGWDIPVSSMSRAFPPAQSCSLGTPSIPLRAAGVKDTGRGPPGLTGGSGGMLGGEDLDCIFTSTGDPGITGTLFSPATVPREGGKA